LIYSLSAKEKEERSMRNGQNEERKAREESTYDHEEPKD
jgi:hypothetical protein